jgi:lysine 2,3-aminomutase
MSRSTNGRPEPPAGSQDSNGASGADDTDPLLRLREIDAPPALKPPAAPSALRHRSLTKNGFWRRLEPYHDISDDEFLSHAFQNKNSVTSLQELNEAIGPLVHHDFLEDVAEGMEQAPMLLRLSPYLLSLIDWDDPYHDPLRRQFIPVASTRESDHPMLTLDSLAEQDDSPVSGLVHRYDDKVLFLALDVCPVYCRFCTRSYAIGGDTESVSKVDYKPVPKKWDQAFAYLLSRPEVEDVVVSGGDAYFLPASRIRTIGETLLAIPHIQRIRFATKGPAVMPMKVLSDTEWSDTLIELAQRGRQMHKEVCLHTHFNHANEITDVTRRAMQFLYREGVTIRNQSVMIRGVNDSDAAMTDLVKTLSAINVQPYYVYQHDMVQGVEELRTRVSKTCDVEKAVRGVTAGFNTPTFVTDAPGGGGKRVVHSYEHYDEETGISVYRSPAVDADKAYLYFDPLSRLPEEGQDRWDDESEHGPMIEEALQAAGCASLIPANLEQTTI